MAEAVHVPAHLVPPGSPQAKQLRHLHVSSTLTGAELLQAKKVLHLSMQGCFGSVPLFVTL